MSKTPENHEIENRIRELDPEIRHHLGHILRNHFQHVSSFIEIQQYEQALKHIEFAGIDLRRLKL